MAYTTLAKVKTYLGIESDNTVDDSLLTDLLSRAVTMIEKETGQNFEPVTATKEFSRECIDYNSIPRVLYLDKYYLQTLTEVTNGNSQTIPNSDLVLTPKNQSAYTKIHIKSSSTHSWEFDDLYDSFISVEGTWGLFATVPADVEHYTIRLIAYLYKQKDNHQDLDRTLIAGNTTILPQSMPNDILGFFKRYRKIF